MPKSVQAPPAAAEKVFLDTQSTQWDDFGEITKEIPDFIRFEMDARSAYRGAHAIGHISRLMSALHVERAHADDGNSPNYMGSISDCSVEALFYAVEELSNHVRACVFRMSKNIAQDLKRGDK